MAKEFLVDKHWPAGEELLRRLCDKQFPIEVAFWAKEPDSDSWHLFIASQHVDSSGLRVAYGEVGEVMGELSEEERFWLGPFDIKLIKAGSSVARAATEFRESWTVPAYHVMAHHGGPLLGGMAVEDVYVYPAIGHPCRPPSP